MLTPVLLVFFCCCSSSNRQRNVTLLYALWPECAMALQPLATSDFQNVVVADRPKYRPCRNDSGWHRNRTGTGTSELNFARSTSYPPNCYTTVCLPRPLTPLHSPVLGPTSPVPRPVLARSSIARSSPGLARPRPALAWPSPGPCPPSFQTLAVKTGKREIY